MPWARLKEDNERLRKEVEILQDKLGDPDSKVCNTQPLDCRPRPSVTVRAVIMTTSPIVKTIISNVISTIVSVSTFAISGVFRNWTRGGYA